ncbi:4-oxalocrotonate tautomerase [Roseovarius sp. LXJ103]|uniref:4-oxalocrotonate tautomerase n=1 Tax=Roseovarius carneus TaxID=2853164 RepID=UPI000D61217E|nr:4-oxalocrotonate tautomerase [Roseovarius carneus]PWE36112.1 4-oxalocrotonate tautomerase [Pelagicola sp. LXJ1103]
MPIIRVEMFEGRTPDQKRALVRELTDAFVRVTGASAEAVDVMLVDMDKANWGKAGTLYADKDPH